MCGVVGYVGPRPAVPWLLKGLERLEYRGYDSAGLAVLTNDTLEIRRTAGQLQALRDDLAADPPADGSTAIGHLRWATHGAPTEANAHPHTDCNRRFAVVHNGIIENEASLRRQLLEAGHRFTSETDTELIAHLLESFADDLDLAERVRRAIQALQGAFALLIVDRRQPERIVAVRHDSPLFIGVLDDATLVASDFPPLLDHTRQVYILDDGEMADIRAGRITITDFEGKPVAKQAQTIDWDVEQAEKGGYDHFMLKEIHEQPQALQATLAGRIEGDAVALADLDWTPSQWQAFDNVLFLACGTSYHASLVAAKWIERLAGMPAQAAIASEFADDAPWVDGRTLVVAVSQSGETKDTLTAMHEAKRRGATTLAIVNVVGSSLARDADAVLYTHAGPEIAVASTKAYTTQLLTGALLALHLAQQRGVPAAERARLLAALRQVPEAAARLLDAPSAANEVGHRLAQASDAFYIGRGLDYASALEGQLKLKEITYIHAEAYPAGELKHGALALLEPGLPVVALATQLQSHAKMLGNIQEVRARGALVIAIAREDDATIADYADHVLAVPALDPMVMPILNAIPLQLIAYHAAVARGQNVDQPRNLAKSVTVD